METFRVINGIYDNGDNSTLKYCLMTAHARNEILL